MLLPRPSTAWRDLIRIDIAARAIPAQRRKRAEEHGLSRPPRESNLISTHKIALRELCKRPHQPDSYGSQSAGVGVGPRPLFR